MRGCCVAFGGWRRPRPWRCSPLFPVTSIWDFSKLSWLACDRAVMQQGMPHSLLPVHVQRCQAL